jgi:hypothetical protein
MRDRQLGRIIIVGIATVVVWGSAFAPSASASAVSGSWAALAPVPSRSDGVEGMSVALVGNRIVAAYGFDGGDTRLTRIYSIDTDTWRRGAQAPGPPRSEGAAVAFDEEVYSIGGRGGRVLAAFDRYSPSSDRWTSLRNMPTPRAGLAAAAVSGSIYAIGGRTGTGGPCSQAPGGQLSTVERYDTVSGHWTTVAPLPRARSDLAAAAVNGKIYVFGGCRVRGNTTHFLSAVFVYDPATDSWSDAPAHLPTARAAMYAVAALGGRIFIVGGWAGRGPLGRTEIYSVRHDEYQRGPRMLTPRAEMGVVSRGGKVFAVGGALPAFGNSSDANEVFGP